MSTLKETFIEYYLEEPDYHKWSSDQRKKLGSLFFIEEPDYFTDELVTTVFPDIQKLFLGDDDDMILATSLREKLQSIAWEEFSSNYTFEKLEDEAYVEYHENLKAQHEEYDPDLNQLKRDRAIESYVDKMFSSIFKGVKHVNRI